MKIKKKEKSTFKRNLKIYVIILAILSFTFLMYVLNTLYQYELSFAENYMNTVVQNITKTAQKGQISKICNINNSDINVLEKHNKTYNEALKEIFKTTNISFKKNDKSTAIEPIYDILSNDKKIMTVKLSIKKQEKRLRLFSYPIWQISECNLNCERGLYYYDITVPSNYSIEINGEKLGEEYISEKTKDDSYSEIAKYAKLPNTNNYKIDNLLSKPDIVITDDNGVNVDYVEKNNKIQVKNNYITANSYEEIKDKIASDIDILEIAKNWSLFLTDDLQGTKHGFGTLRKNLIKNSNFYNMAYAWATSVDITFVSSHTLKNPTFTNTSVSDFVVYNKNAFSCVVKLEKNMRIANTRDKVDTMYDRLYFVYYDDVNDNIDGPTWKLVDMKAITE